MAERCWQSCVLAGRSGKTSALRVADLGSSSAFPSYISKFTIWGLSSPATSLGFTIWGLSSPATSLGFTIWGLSSPATSLGFTIWGENICICDCYFLNPTIEVVTIRLRGWCMLRVFLLPVFTRLGHECQDLLSTCDGMHVCTD